MNIRFILFLTGLIFFFNPAFSQRLLPFTSITGTIVSSGAKEQVPYERPIGYYDFINEDELPDETINDSSFYDVYFELPAAVNEIGIRLISPVPEYVFADRGDIVTDKFESYYKTNKSTFFDPAIKLEQGVFDSNKKFEIKQLLAVNDNSKEVIAQPDGRFNNALLRVVSTEGYAAGLYRIRISGNKNMVRGSFLIHLGLVPSLRGVNVWRK